MMRRAVYPGTFDPITVGHLDVVYAGAKLFDEIHLLVFPRAEKNPIFTVEQRFEMAKAAIGDRNWFKVHIGEGLVVNQARKLGARTIIKGVRTVTDFQDELAQQMANRRLAPDIQTIFVPTSKEHLDVSSTIVRQFLMHHVDYDVFGEMLPAPVLDIIKDIVMSW